MLVTISVTPFGRLTIMSGMLRVKVKWSGFNGAPGYSNFYFRDFTSTGEPVPGDAQLAVDRVQTFLTAIKSNFPSVVSLAIQPDVEVIESSDGKMKDVFSATAPAASVGTATVQQYAGATGLVINWRTAGVRNGRRVRGRTFLVPVTNASFDTDGTVKAAVLTPIQTAASALADGAGTPDLGVWARPSAPLATDGSWHPVTSATVPDLAAILRSRRD